MRAGINVLVPREDEVYILRGERGAQRLSALRDVFLAVLFVQRAAAEQAVMHGGDAPDDPVAVRFPARLRRFREEGGVHAVVLYVAVEDEELHVPRHEPVVARLRPRGRTRAVARQVGKVVVLRPVALADLVVADHPGKGHAAQRPRPEKLFVLSLALRQRRRAGAEALHLVAHMQDEGGRYRGRRIQRILPCGAVGNLVPVGADLRVSQSDEAQPLSRRECAEGTGLRPRACRTDPPDVLRIRLQPGNGRLEHIIIDFPFRERARNGNLIMFAGEDASRLPFRDLQQLFLLRRTAEGVPVEIHLRLVRADERRHHRVIFRRGVCTPRGKGRNNGERAYNRESGNHAGQAPES